MKTNDLTMQLTEARVIAQKLNDLLHDDALHRLRLYQEYSYEVNPK